VDKIADTPSSSMKATMNGLLDVAKETDDKHQRELNHVQDNHPLVSLTIFQRQAGWPEKFENQDMKPLVDLTKKPKNDEPELLQVWGHTKSLIARCFDGIQDLHRRNWHIIPFWLASAQPEQEESVPFR
jgi:hypothetical protein